MSILGPAELLQDTKLVRHTCIRDRMPTANTSSLAEQQVSNVGEIHRTLRFLLDVIHDEDGTCETIDGYLFFGRGLSILSELLWGLITRGIGIIPAHRQPCVTVA